MEEILHSVKFWRNNVNQIISSQLGGRYCMRFVEIRRDKISSQMYEYVLKRDRHTCRYCGSKTPPFHLDHVYPVVKGGETSAENLATSCRRCNEKKHTSIIFPKPIGYFEKTPHFSIPNTLLLAFGVSCVANGVWVWSEFLVYARTSILLGLIVLLFTLARLSTGR